MDANRSRWAGRFIGATFILGGIAWAVIAVLVLGNVLAGLEPPNYALGPASSRIVAAGGPGTWFVMGLLSYMLIGVAGVGMSALFYNHIEVTFGAPLAGWKNVAAWIHLILGGIGSAGASLVMTYGGYAAGVANLPTNVGGGGHVNDFAYIHANILNPLVVPIAGLMAVALLGYLIGGIGLAAGWMAARKA
jgi:hypothetical protein